mmetsp:Transcript_37562/g.45347  ORF Transcript_37562/g.45347 Transcript_37562/m.45347 type:complete len:175 (-) Transcript_37562:131-655(-)
MPPSHLLLDCSNNSPTATLYESGICLPLLPPLVDRMSSCSIYERDQNSLNERKESLAILLESAPRIPLFDDDEYNDYINFSLTARSDLSWRLAPRQNTLNVGVKFYESDATMTDSKDIEHLLLPIDNLPSFFHTRRRILSEKECCFDNTYMLSNSTKVPIDLKIIPNSIGAHTA